MRHRKRLLIIGFPALLVLLSISALVALSSSPAIFGAAASLVAGPAGYRVQAEAVAFRGLGTEIRGLEIRDKTGKVTFAAARLAVASGPGAMIKGEIESLTLTEPRFFVHVKGGKKKSDFSALEKLPPVRLLTIAKGEFVFATESLQVTASGVDAEVRNFSPRSGGSLKLTSRLRVSSEAKDGPAAAGTVTADARLTALFPRPAGKGSLAIRISPATVGNGALDDVRVLLPFNLSGDKVVIDRARADIAGLVYPATGQGLSVPSAWAEARLTYDLQSANVTIDGLRAEAPGLASVDGAADAVLTDEMPWKARFAVSALDFRGIFQTMKPLVPAEYRTWQLEGKGSMEAAVRGNLGPSPGLEGECLLRFSGGGFTSGDKMKAAQKLTGSAKLKLRWPVGAEKGGFDTRVSAGDGEFLWGTYYRDLKGKEVTVEATGTCGLVPSPQAEWAGTVNLPVVTPIAFSGSFGDREFTLSLRNESIAHEKGFELLFGDMADKEGPLSSVRVAGESALSVTLRLARGRTRLQGRVETRDAMLQAPALDLVVTGVNADVPFDLDSAPPENAPPPPSMGFIRADGLSKGDIRLTTIEVPLAVSLNRVDLPRQVDVPLFGGTVSLPRFQAKDLLSGSPSLDFSLHVTHVDLGDLSPRASGITFEGFLDATFPSIRFSRGRWTADGRGKVRAFGGEVVMTNLFGERLFAAGRSVGGNVSFTGIDLEKLTKRIPLGRMTGVVNGSLKGFVMEYGQPAAFDLTIESDASAPGSRVISVEAIENLSIVGTGSAAVGLVLKGGLNRFFKEYPYSRMGIRCVLENDVFSIRGTIHEQDKEYLIRRGLWRGIDVINQNPGSTISFRDMQERIGRVFRKEETAKRVSQAGESCYNSTIPTGGA